MQWNARPEAMRRRERRPARAFAAALGVFAGAWVVASGAATADGTPLRDRGPHAGLERFVRWDAERVRAEATPDPEAAGYRAVVVEDSADVCAIELQPLGRLLSALTPEAAARRVRVSGDAAPDGRFDQPFLDRTVLAPTTPDGAPYPPYWRAPSPAWVQLDFPRAVRVTRIAIVPPPGEAVPRLTRVEGAMPGGPLFALAFRSLSPGEDACVEAAPELAPTHALRASLEADGPDADAVSVETLRVYGVPADEVCVADVVVRGLTRFPVTDGPAYAVEQDGRPARWSEAVADGAALRICGVRWSGDASLRIRRCEAGAHRDPAAPGEPVPLMNAGFEAWDADRPSGWTVREGHGHFLRPDKALAVEGKHALRAGGVYYYLFLRQTTTLPADAAGRVVELTASVRAFEPDSAYVSMDPPEYGEVCSARHPGDGRVHTLRASCRIPAFSRDLAIVVNLGHSGVPKRPAWFDDVRLTVR